MKQDIEVEKPVYYDLLGNPMLQLNQNTTK